MKERRANAGEQRWKSIQTKLPVEILAAVPTNAYTEIFGDIRAHRMQPKTTIKRAILNAKTLYAAMHQLSPEHRAVIQHEKVVSSFWHAIGKRGSLATGEVDDVANSLIESIEDARMLIQLDGP
jgi:hypothetical protein